MVKVEIDHKRCGIAGECIDICPNGVYVWEKTKVNILEIFESERKMPVPKYQEKCIGCMKYYNLPYRMY